MIFIAFCLHDRVRSRVPELPAYVVPSFLVTVENTAVHDLVHDRAVTISRPRAKAFLAVGRLYPPRHKCSVLHVHAIGVCRPPCASPAALHATGRVLSARVWLHRGGQGEYYDYLWQRPRRGRRQGPRFAATGRAQVPHCTCAGAAEAVSYTHLTLPTTPYV